jgi:hypothetical protein
LHKPWVANQELHTVADEEAAAFEDLPQQLQVLPLGDGFSQRGKLKNCWESSTENV